MENRKTKLGLFLWISTFANPNGGDVAQLVEHRTENP